LYGYKNYSYDHVLDLVLYLEEFTKEMMFEVVPKEALYVLFALFGCYTITTNFDIYMSKGTHNIFVLVVNYEC
jgi:hypothetical protein